MVIPSEVRVERLRADKEGEFIRNDFKGYCTQTGVLLEYDSTNTSQKMACTSESEGRSRPWSGACLLTADYERFFGGS